MTTIINGTDAIAELVGKEFGPSDWLEITQDRVNQFADATDDHQWIHVDPERAAAGPFGTTIAHGYLVLSLVIPLWSDVVRVDGVRMGINYGLNRVRFVSPVPVGSRVRLLGRLKSVDPAADGSVQVVVEFTIEREGGEKPAAVAEAIYRYYA